MKRLLIGALTAATFVSIAPAQAVQIGTIVTDFRPLDSVQAKAKAERQEVQAKPGDRWIGKCDGWQMGETLQPSEWNANPDVAEMRIKRLIACVFAEWAPGESVTALIIADRESGFYPWASNGGSYLGLFQHGARYWDGRRDAYLERGWFGNGVWPVSAFDARANAICAARMVRANGWGAWSTYG